MKRSMVFHRGLLETKMEEIPEVTKKLAPFAKKQSRNIIMEKKIRKRYHSEEAVKNAGENAELFDVNGASHMDLYYKDKYVEIAVDKLTDFFTRSLEK